MPDRRKRPALADRLRKFPGGNLERNPSPSRYVFDLDSEREFREQLGGARRIMMKHRNVLRALAKAGDENA